MLTSVVSTAVAATSTTASVAATSAISLTTPIGLPEYGVLAVIALIVLLSAKEILSASDKWNRALNSSLNLSIYPLLFCFALIVISQTLLVLK
jgi:hypothetical protein